MQLQSLGITCGSIVVLDSSTADMGNTRICTGKSFDVKMD